MKGGIEVIADLFLPSALAGEFHSSSRCRLVMLIPRYKQKIQSSEHNDRPEVMEGNLDENPGLSALILYLNYFS